MAEVQVLVEIVAKKKGCVLCDLAIGILEEIASELEGAVMTWEVVDVGVREGVLRHAELAKICGRKPSVPSIVINEKIAFDHIPDYQSLENVILGIVRQEELGKWWKRVSKMFLKARGRNPILEVT